MRKIALLVVPALLIAGCGTSQPSAAEKSAGLAKQYASFANGFADVLREVGAQASAQNVQGLKESCVKMENSANEGLALPDFSPELDKHWDAGMTDYRSAAQACVNGNFSATLTYVNAGAAEIKLATAAIPSI